MKKLQKKNHHPPPNAHWSKCPTGRSVSLRPILIQRPACVGLVATQPPQKQRCKPPHSRAHDGAFFRRRILHKSQIENKCLIKIKSPIALFLGRKTRATQPKRTLHNTPPGPLATRSYQRGSAFFCYFTLPRQRKVRCIFYAKFRSAKPTKINHFTKPIWYSN